MSQIESAITSADYIVNPGETSRPKSAESAITSND